MERIPLIAGNWKMHATIAEAERLAAAVVEAARGAAGREVMIAPPFTALPAVAKVVAGSKVALAGQNVCWEAQGAFTGEISPIMLRELGCSMAIVGHSERRHVFGEGDAMVNKRLRGALRFDLTPVLCVGETIEEREAGRTFEVLERQVRGGLAGVDLAVSPLVVAYEPVWAIGTGKTATISQAQEAHAHVRDLLGRLSQKKIAAQLRILYGGSVKPENADDLLRQPDIDGALVGGASLSPESFGRIINFQE
ncbi:MAG: triose-phosphate isomerase [Desulfobacteraceae bacterium]|nr:triose-phosphate isomerase [Desulfobacteraceae bacterium]